MDEPESKPLTGKDLREALSAVQAMLAGQDPGLPNPENPVLMGLLESLGDYSLDGYLPGRRYTEQEVRDLPLGTVLWIRWCKDDNPDDCRFDGAYMLTAKDNDACGTGAFEVHSGEDWKFDGDTSRGIAHYSVAVKATRAEVREYKRTLRLVEKAQAAQRNGDTKTLERMLAKLREGRPKPRKKAAKRK